MKKRNEKFFKMACNMAKKSKERYKVGCVVVLKNRILSTGFNCGKTHPLQKIYNKIRFKDESFHSLHAEIHALSQIKSQKIPWNKVDIYICRITNTGLGLSRPCKSCMEMIKHLGIHNLYYTTNNQTFQHEII